MQGMRDEDRSPAAVQIACRSRERQKENRMSKFGTKNKDSKKAEEKKVRQQLAALERKKAKAAAKKK